MYRQKTKALLLSAFVSRLQSISPYLLQVIGNSSLSRHDTLVIPGPKLSLAMDMIMRPMVTELMAQKSFA